MGRLKTHEERIGKKWARKHLKDDSDGPKVTRHDLGFEGKQGQSKAQVIEHIGRGRIRQKI